MKYMKFVHIPVLTLLKKKYKRSIKLFCHRGQTPNIRTTKICSSKEISKKKSTAIAPRQAIICLDSNSHASKVPTPALLTSNSPQEALQK